MLWVNMREISLTKWFFFHLWNIQLYLSLKNKLPSQSPVKCPICFTPLDPESISLKWISLKKFLSVRERTFSVLRVKLSISLRGSPADWRIVLLSKSLLTISKHLLVRISSGTPFYFTNVLPKFAVAQWNWQLGENIQSVRGLLDGQHPSG